MFASINVCGIRVLVGNGNAAPGMRNVSSETQRQFVGAMVGCAGWGREELTYLDSLRDAQNGRKNYNHLCASK